MFNISIIGIEHNGGDVKWYHYLAIFNEKIFDVGKPGRILDVAIFIFNIHFQNVGFVIAQLWSFIWDNWAYRNSFLGWT